MFAHLTGKFQIASCMIAVGGLLVCAAALPAYAKQSQCSAATIPISVASQLRDIASNLSGNYCLTQDIVATGTIIPPIGNAATPFIGQLDGNGFTISGLTVIGSDDRVGFFGEVGPSGKIINLTLQDLTVRAPAGYDLGGLAGRNHGVIINSSTSGSISGLAADPLKGIAIGGLIGWNFGSVRRSHSSMAISSSGTRLIDLGGLTGGNDGFISRSYATGAVSSAASDRSAAFGGLVGYNEFNGTIQASHASGPVHADGSNGVAGGLVGISRTGHIQQSYATGAVSSQGLATLGGLVGYMDENGSISQSFSTSSVTEGGFGFAGGLVGELVNSSVSQSYARGEANASNLGGAAGLVAWGFGSTITQSYATGRVTGAPSFSGGLVGNSGVNPPTIINSYWDVSSTGQSGSFGATATPNATADLKATLPTGFDPDVWKTIPNASYPFFSWQTRISQLHTAANEAPYGNLDPLTPDGAFLTENETCLAVVYLMLASASGDAQATVQEFWSSDGAVYTPLLSLAINLAPAPSYTAARNTQISGNMLSLDNSAFGYLKSAPIIIGGTIKTSKAGNHTHFMLGTATGTLNGTDYIFASDPWTGTTVAINSAGDVMYVMDPNPANPNFYLLKDIMNGTTLPKDIQADFNTLPVASTGAMSYEALASFNAKGFAQVQGP